MAIYEKEAYLPIIITPTVILYYYWSVIYKTVTVLNVELSTHKKYCIKLLVAPAALFAKCTLDDIKSITAHHRKAQHRCFDTGLMRMTMQLATLSASKTAG